MLSKQRIQLWLDTVGKNVFGIKHHWLRFEFAPSCGQTHAHMSCIHEDPTFLQEDHRLRANKTLQASYLQDWAEQSFGMTASLPKCAELEKQVESTLQHSTAVTQRICQETKLHVLFTCKTTNAMDAMCSQDTMCESALNHLFTFCCLCFFTWCSQCCWFSVPNKEAKIKKDEDAADVEQESRRQLFMQTLLVFH
jgi:hypothetical protein